MRRLREAVVLGFASASALALVTQTAATAASASTTPYELYCPGTPVGNIVLNDTVTSGVVTPAAPSVHQRITLSGVQVSLVVPIQIASAAQALGNAAISGSVQVNVHATGAKPSTKRVRKQRFEAPIPAKIPPSGLAITIPSSPVTVGNFRVTSLPVTVSQASSFRLALVISGSRLALRCLSYPNDSAPTGISNAAPSGYPIAPVIEAVG